MTRILVTGGSGFIGSNLVRHLAPQGHEIVNLDIAAPLDADAQGLWQRVDLLDAPALRRAVGDFAPEIIVHLAARTDLDGRSVDDYCANTTGVANLIDAAAPVPVLERVIFASSRLVCRIGYAPEGPRDYNATTHYGRSKVIGEGLVYDDRRLRCPLTIVRPTSIWGPFFRVPYRNFFDMVRRRRFLQPRGHAVLKSFGYVGNAVVQLERLMSAPHALIDRRMFYLADYEPLELRAWSQMIACSFGVDAAYEVPKSALAALARMGDGLAALGWRQVPLTSFRLDNLLTPMVHDLEPLRQVCGATPFDLAEGTRATVDWILKEAA